MIKINHTGKGHVTTHGRPKKTVVHVRRKGQKFTVHGAAHIRLVRPKKPGGQQVLLGP